jgi:hypothetical protein
MSLIGSFSYGFTPFIITLYVFGRILLLMLTYWQKVTSYQICHQKKHIKIRNICYNYEIYIIIEKCILLLILC